MKKRITIKITKQKKIAFFIISVTIITFILFKYFNDKINPKLIYYANLEFEEKVNKLASSDNIVDVDLNNLLNIITNDKKEILSVDYQMDKIYDLTKKVTDNLNNSLKDVTNFKYNANLNNNNLIFYLPMGMASDYVLLNNLGPKIPVGVKFISSVFTNVKTKLTNYGINNCLIEIYIEVTLNYALVTPIKETQKSLNYNILLDAKIINGTVPNWYGGEIVKSSAVFKSIL